MSFVTAKFGSNMLLARKWLIQGIRFLLQLWPISFGDLTQPLIQKSIGSNTWKGANRLGVILMELCENLKHYYPIQPTADNLEDNLLGLTMSQSPVNATLSAGPSGSQSNHPVAPVCSRKRNNEVLSPGKAPPASSQKVSSPRGQTGSMPNLV